MRFSGKTVVITGAASGIGAASSVTGTSLLVDGGITLGPRLGRDPAEPQMFADLLAMEEDARQAHGASPQ